jgi:hypothetical protein
MQTEMVLGRPPQDPRLIVAGKRGALQDLEQKLNLPDKREGLHISWNRGGGLFSDKLALLVKRRVRWLSGLNLSCGSLYCDAGGGALLSPCALARSGVLGKRYTGEGFAVLALGEQ